MGDLPEHERAWEYMRGSRNGFAVDRHGHLFLRMRSVFRGVNKAFYAEITRCFALLAITGFVRAVLPSGQERCKSILLLSYSVWFLPFLMVRSVQNLVGLCSWASLLH